MLVPLAVVPINGFHRLGNGLRVMMDAVICLSNAPVNINAIVMVVPKSVMPNERIGILFG